MIYRIITLLLFFACLFAPGCSTNSATPIADVRLFPGDIDALTGAPWIGKLTYLDYTSNEHTTIDSSLSVRRVGDSPASWEFGVGYSKEPHADSHEILELSRDGRRLGNEQVFMRESLPGGGLRFVTECDGEDNLRASRFRFEHTLTAHGYSRRKLVRFNDEAEFFERHVYRWERMNDGPALGEPTDRIAAADLKADLSTLRRVFEAIHPGLYRYNTREQMAAHFAALEEAWGRDSTMAEAFQALSLFTAKIKCGHTFPNPVNQSETVKAKLFMRSDKVPFAFRWVGGRMIVTRNLSANSALKPGTEVLSINGNDANTILDRLMTFARADGSNDAKRVSLMEVTGTQRFEAFDIYFPLVFPQKSSAFALKVRSPGEREAVTITVAAATSEVRLAAQGVRGGAADDGDEPLWTLSELPSGTAYLPMDSWVAYKTTWDWAAFINDTFDSLVERQVSNLVIDLRGNEGGSSVGDVILARLIEAPVPRSSNQRFVRYLKTPPELDAVLDTWDSSFRDWGKDAIGPMDLADRNTGLATGTTGGFYRLRNDDGNDPDAVDAMILPRGPRFGGRVFVLVDASNSSATFEFVSLVKAHKLGTVIGQPTGGNQRGINGGAFFFLRLPKTGLELDLPIMAQFPKRGLPVATDGGIMPDLIVTPTVDDLTSGLDSEISAVQRLIDSMKRHADCAEVAYGDQAGPNGNSTL